MKRSRFILLNAACTVAIVGYVVWCWSGFMAGATKSWDNSIPEEARAIIEERLDAEGAIDFKSGIAMRALADPYQKPRLYVFVDHMEPHWIEVTTVVTAGTKDTRGGGYGLFLIDGEWIWSDAPRAAGA